MADAAESTSAGPIEETGRITNLDALRGVAVFGILLMNAVSYGLEPAAYFNISLANDTPLDWIIGVFGEVFVDQRFMGVFSLLFGAGIVLFADRADAKGNRGGWLSLWRNLLLLGIGLLHMWLWGEGRHPRRLRNRLAFPAAVASSAERGAVRARRCARAGFGCDLRGDAADSRCRRRATR